MYEIAAVVSVMEKMSGIDLVRVYDPRFYETAEVRLLRFWADNPESEGLRLFVQAHD